MSTRDHDGGSEADVCGEDAGSVATRQIMVATLSFLGGEIRENLQETDPGVSSVLHLIEVMASDIKKALTHEQIAKAEIPAGLAAGHTKSLGSQAFFH